MDMFIKWLNMLRGKPVASSKPEDDSASQKKESPKQDAQEQKIDTDPALGQTPDDEFYFAGDKSIQEDSVVQDFRSAQKIAQSVVNKVKSAPIPHPEIPKKGQESGVGPEQVSEKPAPAVMVKLSNQLLGKIIRIVVIVVLTLILVFVSISLFRMISNRSGLQNGAGGPFQSDGSLSPTPVSYRPYEPSIYANDPEILRIEEEVAVLDAELFRTSISDPVVRPPNLDFNISF